MGKGNRRHGSSTIIAGHRLVTPIKFVPYANDHPTLSRLRAAAALIPMIQSGLADTKLSREQASSMTLFIEWAASSTPENDVEQQLVNELTVDLAGLKAALEV